MDSLFNTLSKKELKTLTYLYLQNQNLSALSPKELLDKYCLIYRELEALNGTSKIPTEIFEKLP